MLSQLYQKLLIWWTVFRIAFSDVSMPTVYVIWNTGNKEMKPDDKHNFYNKTYVPRLWKYV